MIGIRKAGSDLSQINSGTESCLNQYLAHSHCSHNAHIHTAPARHLPKGVPPRHDPAPVARFLNEGRRRGLLLPGLFGVFYYRSANPRTLATLGRFLDVPAVALTREFEAGATAEEVCACTIRALLDLGARHFYVSNLPVGRAAQILSSIMKRVAVRA